MWQKFKELVSAPLCVGTYWERLEWVGSAIVWRLLRPQVWCLAWYKAQDEWSWDCPLKCLCTCFWLLTALLWTFSLRIEGASESKCSRRTRHTLKGFFSLSIRSPTALFRHILLIISKPWQPFEVHQEGTYIGAFDGAGS